MVPRRCPVNRVDALQDWNFSQPDKAAIVFEDERISFGKLLRRIERQAARMAPVVSRGDIVALYLDNTPDFVVAEYASFWLGARVCPLNRILTHEEIAETCRRLGVRAMVTDDPSFGDAPVPVLTVDDGGAEPTPAVASMGLDDGCFVLLTSGSTGQPKGVSLTYRNVMSNYDRCYRWLDVSSSDVLLMCLPLYNTFGLNQGINLMATAGATMILHRSFSPDRVTRALRDEGVTFFPAVPTMISRLRSRNEGVITDRPIKTGVGAAPTGTTVVSDLWDLLPGARAGLGYGLTEATALVTHVRVGTRDEADGVDLSTVGPPVPGCEVELLDVDETGVGEIGIRGDWVFDSYVGTDEVRPVVDGWLRTGDLANRSEDGHFHIVDRRRDLIIRGGQNIYPGEVERALYRHPDVLEVAVIGRQDADLGEQPIAYVSRRPGAQTSADELQAHCAASLASFKLPAEIVVVGELPRGATGKISKPALREADALR